MPRKGIFPTDKNGKYVTLSLLKEMKNANNVHVFNVVTDKMCVDVPAEVVQTGPSSDTSKFETKIYFNLQKEVYVRYFLDNGQPKVIQLHHLNEVSRNKA